MTKRQPDKAKPAFMAGFGVVAGYITVSLSEIKLQCDIHATGRQHG